MTQAELRARVWCAMACALAQVAATSAGMVPWWALPITLALTVAVSQPTGPVDQTRARLTRGLGVASVAAFAAIIAVRTVGQTRAGVIDPTSTLRSLSEALVVLSLIMAPTARSPREHRVWLTVTTGVLVAAAAGSRTFADGAFAGTAWIVLLIATNMVQTTDAYAHGAVAGSIVGMPARERQTLLGRSHTTLPIIATLLAGVVVYYALPASLGGGDLARSIAHQVQQANLALANRADVGVDTRGFGDLDLLVRGQLPGNPLLLVPNNAPLLWRGTFYRTYSGTSWDNPGTGVFAEVPGPSGRVPPNPDDPLPIGGRTLTDQVQVEPAANADLIWAPGVPTAVSGQRGQVDHIIRGPNNVRVSGDGVPLTTYTVRSVVPSSNPTVLAAAHGADPSAATWTQLPPELPAEVSSLARQVTAGATNRYQMVTAIENYLRANETYSLSAPEPPPGKDAVDDFLFHTHVGFCELFASAEAVMLRSLGVPARVVSGLAYGTQSKAGRLFTASNAHAWVEVYYPGVGWSPSDPTAGVELFGGASSTPSFIARFFNFLAGAVPGGRIAVAVIGAALLVGIGWLVRSSVRGDGWPLRRRRRVGPQRPGPVLAAFVRMTRSRPGPPPRAPAETARQYLARVGGAQTDVSAAVTALEQELYGVAPPTDAEIRAAVATLESLVAPNG